MTVALAALRAGEDGKIDLWEAGLAGFAYALIKHCADPALPAALRDVTILCLGLLQQPASAPAGSRLLQIVSGARAHLPALRLGAENTEAVDELIGPARRSSSETSRTEQIRSALGARVAGKKDKKGD